MASGIRKLERRVLGKSNLSVSRLCYGTLAFSIYHANLSLEKSAELLVKAYEYGVNFWDTAELYETYSHVNQALKELKSADDIVISSRSYATSYDDMLSSIEKCLRETGRDYIEIFGLHEVQKDEFDGTAFRKGAMRALVQARNNGLIKAISITTHSAKVVDIAAGIDELDVIMPLINYKGIGIKDGSLNDMELAIKKAKAQNKGIYAMKVLAGGGLAENVKSALAYAIVNDFFDSIAIGMDSLDELIFNMSVFFGENIYLDLEEKLKSKKRSIHIEPWCEGCGNCIKICPQDAITMEFAQAKIIEEKCVRCGYCITACKDFYIKFW
ncbi:MAG: aldo/keto reductase [uncultured bacterium]|nr:MAG: aldo/keto reductase [uncultured bacterium]HBH18015.1 aldo/keto reductase [Cyanobacteria bacterium UBA9579]